MAIYIVANEERTAVKIGYSSDPKARIASLQTANPRPLECIGINTAGGRVHEKALHRLLAEWRLEGEWFCFDSGPVQNTVKAVAEGWLPDVPMQQTLFVPVEATEILAKDEGNEHNQIDANQYDLLDERFGRQGELKECWIVGYDAETVLIIHHSSRGTLDIRLTNHRDVIAGEYSTGTILFSLPGGAEAFWCIDRLTFLCSGGKDRDLDGRGPD